MQIMKQATHNDWISWLGEARASSYQEVAEHLDLSELADWNQRICGALLGDIGHVEVALRNILNRALLNRESSIANSGSWLDDPNGDLRRMGGEVILTRIQTARIQAATLKNGLRDDDVVAELSLGFWLSLFSSKFRALQPDLVSSLTGLNGRNIRSVVPRLNEFRRLRNRLAHNHRVIHRDLWADWKVVVEVAKILEPKLALEVERLSLTPRLIEEFSQIAQAKS
jgi:hypothetical protein